MEDIQRLYKVDLRILEERKNEELMELEKRKNEELWELEKRKNEELRRMEGAKNKEIEKLKSENVEKLKEEVINLRVLLQHSCLNELRTQQKHFYTTIPPDEDILKRYSDFLSLDHLWTTALQLPLSSLETLVQSQKNLLSTVHSLVENKKQDNKLCLVCWEYERNTACVPCGHCIYCAQCSGRMEQVPCAVCRMEVEQMVRIFLT